MDPTLLAMMAAGGQGSSPSSTLPWMSTATSSAAGGPVSVGGLNAPPYPFSNGWPNSGTGVLSGNALSISNGAVLAVAVIGALVLLVALKKKG